MIKIWKFLNGNKTIIGTFLLLLLSQSFAKSLFNPETMQLVVWVISTLTGASFIQHIAKGKFTTKKD